MKNSKNIIKMIKDNKKKSTVLMALIICLCTYVISGGLLTEKANSDDIPLHDGDVLVDNSAIVTSDNVSESENTDSYFSELRANLEMDRNKIISMLSEEEKARLLNHMEQEKTIETLIKNKGLPDSFVVITDSGINVTVNTEDLDQETVTKICEIIIRQTGCEASEIVVQDAS